MTEAAPPTEILPGTPEESDELKLFQQINGQLINGMTSAAASVYIVQYRRRLHRQ